MSLSADDVFVDDATIIMFSTAYKCINSTNDYRALHYFTATAGYSQSFIAIFLTLATLKPQSNGPSYSNTVIGTLVVDGWAVTFGTAMRGLGGTAARLGPSSPYQM